MKKQSSFKILPYAGYSQDMAQMPAAPATELAYMAQPAAAAAAAAQTAPQTLPLASAAIAVEQSSSGEPLYGPAIPNRIFVGGISRDTTETDLFIAFSVYGTVRNAKIICDRDGYNKGYGFVTFDTDEEAKSLQVLPRCVILRNHRLNIAPAFKKQNVQRYKPQALVERNNHIYYGAQQPAMMPNMGAQNYLQPMLSAGISPIYAQAYPAATAMQYPSIYQCYNMNMPNYNYNNYYNESNRQQAMTATSSGVNWEYDVAGAGNNVIHF
ncbi:protein boule-like [Drosophila busckii]|uniref:protein boule-like n=1 Tax=Drosophila busckii TaxID=30019 RepID=UPI00083EDF70|nr:protein boule-like [Drosophila busckii]